MSVYDPTGDILFIIILLILIAFYGLTFPGTKWPYIIRNDLQGHESDRGTVNWTEVVLLLIGGSVAIISGIIVIVARYFTYAWFVGISVMILGLLLCLDGLGSYYLGNHRVQ